MRAVRASALAGWAAVTAAALACAGCGTSGGTTMSFPGEDGAPIPSRPGSVVVEACQLDPWQSEQLSEPATAEVIQTVILVCPTASDQGSVAPVEAPAQDELAQQIATIRAMGYRVRLALTMADELGNPYSSDVMQTSLASASWRASVVSAAKTFAAMADGLDLYLPPPPDASGQDVTRLVQALSTAVGSPALDVFVPPGWTSDDVPGAAAYDLASIGPLVNRVHALTLDYSADTGAPGPTIDPGWAVDVQRAAAAQTSAVVDVAMPLYGWDFGPSSTRAVTYLEAEGVASAAGLHAQRGPTGALHYDWQDDSGGSHETWFDDGTSTSWTLAAWSTATLPPDVGVVFWGLGSEDPALFTTLAQEMPR